MTAMAESKQMERFLLEGNLCGVHLGMTAEQVRALVGPPDDTGSTSNRYSHPAIYRYGSVELYFSRAAPYALTAIIWQAESNGAFRFASGCGDGSWQLTPEMIRSEAEAFLNRQGYRFEESQHLATADVSALSLPSGVYFAFLRETSKLHSVGISQPASVEAQR